MIMSGDYYDDGETLKSAIGEDRQESVDSDRETSRMFKGEGL